MSYKGFHDFYKEYPYKCQAVKVNKTITIPYVKPTEMVCDHKYSLTYKEYITILKCIFKFTLLYLRQGSRLNLPHRLGYLIIKRYQGTYRDFNEGTVRKKNLGLKGGKFKLLWHRKHKDNGVMTQKWKWRVLLTKYSWKYMFDYYKDNFLEFRNLNESTR
jgi:hypothetical protein